MKVEITAQLGHARFATVGSSAGLAGEKWHGRFESDERIPVRLLDSDGNLIGEGHADVRGIVTIQVTDETVSQKLSAHAISAVSIGAAPKPTMDADCPFCGAKSGVPCRSVGNDPNSPLFNRTLSQPHASRGRR